MNARTNYMFVGLFVLMSAAMIVFFVIWLLQPSDERQMQRYRINFTESVSGLNIDSPVKYRGVTIGKVDKIRINPDNVETIEVLIQVEKDSPIKVDTVAKLRPQGITGLTFVDLSRGSKEAPCLADIDDDVPLIKMEPSFFVRIERSFGTASENLSSALIRMKALLDEDNRHEITRILHHAANVVEKIDHGIDVKTFKHIDQLVVETKTLARHLDESVTDLQTLMKSGDGFARQATTSIRTVEKSFAQINETMRVINARNLNGEYSVKEHISPSMKQFEMTMLELQNTLVMLNDLLRRYEQSPSDLLFQYQNPKPGPGEMP